jgi:hypothetical protein
MAGCWVEMIGGSISRRERGYQRKERLSLHDPNAPCCGTNPLLSMLVTQTITKPKGPLRCLRGLFGTVLFCDLAEDRMGNGGQSRKMHFMILCNVCICLILIGKQKKNE